MIELTQKQQQKQETSKIFTINFNFEHEYCPGSATTTAAIGEMTIKSMLFESILELIIWKLNEKSV
jgi:hypothetical protein